VGLVLVKIIIFLFIIGALDICLLLLGDIFMLVAFALSVAGIITIAVLFHQESNLRKAAMTIVLMFMLSAIQIGYGYERCDAGGIAAMVFFTFCFTVVPLVVSAIYYIIRFFIYKWNTAR